jgi:hypothetical protein
VVYVKGDLGVPKEEGGARKRAWTEEEGDAMKERGGGGMRREQTQLH